MRNCQEILSGDTKWIQDFKEILPEDITSRYCRKILAGDTARRY